MRSQRATGVRYNKTIVILIFLVLIFGVIFSEVRAAEQDADPGEENIEEIDEFELLAQEILDKTDDIRVSRPNVTTATQLLAALPERENKISIAVYNIEDKTGQYKIGGSTMVTQGAEDMLITALKRSRQFKVLDRINFRNLSTELDLKEYQRLAEGEGPDLGELTGADYVIDGAVTEYQIDRETGGTGLTIAGIGGSREVAVASTALDLRLIDTTSGEIVWAESLKGRIEGSRVNAQTFSFLGDNIVEFESGQGAQEVINLAVRTLLEEGVYRLIESGI